MTSVVGLPSKEKLGRILADLRRALEQLYGERFVNLILFGSQARGEARDGSDIDVLIVLKGNLDFAREVRRVGPVISDLDLECDEDVCPMFASESEFARTTGQFLSSARREGVAV
jgi:predicted nucleotidyltransferase